ncbi:NUDIX hydrolase [Polymorphobacter fuscus]|uniref:GDP-mannose pyrophosphatase n=1 Tax=Sandarakinorhabdus fusca TaxID=1439888 RepID=A0A7C9GXC0_9SPHN|nr:NUDIX hydrolase [Polymorphobacter fuscus]KAB7647848.1 NUDIX hydrolase [Polymorphobacter fuscus]MQT17154.1 NUDIX domain-containing protein [Polymorphobacter fuscus]NJC08853.1 ADP-ribose pyrophosphatase [Polymorphobacter fuscus]
MTLEWQGKYLEVRKQDTWEYAARVGAMGAAVILAITDAREIVLVEQYRVAHGRRSIELPAGLIGDTDADDTGAAAAARELQEETGFDAATWEEVGAFATSPGMSSEMFTLFRARGLTRTGPGGGVDGEDITVHVVPLAGLADFLGQQRQAGRVIDCRLVVALGLV